MVTQDNTLWSSPVAQSSSQILVLLTDFLAFRPQGPNLQPIAHVICGRCTFQNPLGSTKIPGP